MNWYRLRKFSYKGNIPIMNNPQRYPYITDSPTSYEGMSYLLQPGKTGLGSDNTPSKGVPQQGITNDSDRSEMPDIPSDNDGGDRVGGSSYDTQRPTMRGGGGWMSKPLNPTNSNEYDENLYQKGIDQSIEYSNSVYEEIRKKRRKTNF